MALDEKVVTFKSGLHLIGASPECEAVALPFYCLYLFGLCDASGKLHHPSRDDCLRVSTEVCATEWATASSLSPTLLPECESFQDVDTTCLGMFTDYMYSSTG